MTICQTLTNFYINFKYFVSFFSHLETNPDHFINKLLSLSPTSTLAQLAKGAFTWHRLKNSQEASKLLVPILERTTNPNFFGVFILCTCLFEIQVRRKSSSTDILRILLYIIKSLFIIWGQSYQSLILLVFRSSQLSLSVVWYKHLYLLCNGQA